MINSRACLSICQLILFNAKDNRASLVAGSSQRHLKSREPPLPLYVGLNIHTQTRSRKMLTQMHELGLSISYTRLLEIQDSITSALCKRFKDEDAVCPTQLRTGIYSVGALDNIDHNPTATTAKGSFHGTTISIFQFPSDINPGSSREPLVLSSNTDSQDNSLPDSYRIVPAVNCNLESATVPETTVCEIKDNLEVAKQEESEWFKHSSLLIDKDSLGKGDCVAWSAFHASRQSDETIHAGISSLLPLFHEKAATVAMIKHGMTTIGHTISICNPGQIPVMVVDQPLFALAKQV